MKEVCHRTKSSSRVTFTCPQCKRKLPHVCLQHGLDRMKAHRKFNPPIKDCNGP